MISSASVSTSSYTGAGSHSMQRNDSLYSNRTSTERRRKKYPFMSHVNNHCNHRSNNHRTHFNTAIRDINDISHVQLEQAVRALQCFEGLQEPCDSSYRTFALRYIEGILQRWYHSVQHERSTESSLIETASHERLPSNQALVSPRSFAAVVAHGTSKATSIGSSNDTDTNRTNDVTDDETSRIIWPCLTTTGRISEQPVLVKPTRNAWSRPSSILPTKTTTTTFHTISTNASTSNTAPALIPFGSYRLGVHSTISDMDLLALAPLDVTREDFFTSLVVALKNDPRCQNVHPIPTAYTPVIKFMLRCGDDVTTSKWKGTPNNVIHIDLVFANVADTTKLVEYYRKRKEAQKLCTTSLANALSVQYYLDDTDLQDQDEVGIRSLNGARVTQLILESVRSDIHKFQIVLCAVKHWAQVRGLYSNVLGFLGGVNWAILVAWVCKYYPDASASKTLNLFFHVFAKWRWNNPVLLGDTIAEAPPICNVVTQARAITLPAWNPAVNKRDGLHLMPIITPAYPSMNSSYNVDSPQLRCIQHEMVLTSAMLSRSSNNANKSMVGHNKYGNLFQPSDFFQRHEYFLQVNIASRNEDDFIKWFRFVESKIRNLISSLETTEVHAWPFARFFDVPQSQPGANVADNALSLSNSIEFYEKCLFIGLRVAPGVEIVDVQHLTMDFTYKVNNWDGRNKSTMDLTLGYICADEVPLFVIEAMHQDSIVLPPSRSLFHSKDGSIDSENTAPTSDDEDDDLMPGGTFVKVWEQ
jgi:poly(A) polymerase